MDDNSKRRIDALLIAAWRNGFAEGDKSNLLRILCLCLAEGYVLPTWVKNAVISAFHDVDTGKVSSWDDVFGPAKPLVRKGKRQELAHKILLHVVDAETEGRAVDVTLFDEIGPRLNISGSKAKEYYYEFYKDRRRSSKKSQ